MPARVVLAVVIAFAAMVGGSTGAVSQSVESAPSARAWAIRISTPTGFVTGTRPAITASEAADDSTASFAFPAGGTVISTGATSAAAEADTEKGTATAKASTEIENLVLFEGAITADLVSAGASAYAGRSIVTGAFDGTSVVNLRVLGEPRAGPRIEIEDWGLLTVRTDVVEREKAQGVRSYRGGISSLVLRLTAEHGGLPAGTVIQIGYAEASATQPQTVPEESEEPDREGPTGEEGDEAGSDARQGIPFPFTVPKALLPVLRGGPYVFPVYGDVGFGNSYGDARGTVEYHHGADIFGEAGRPIVACADGTVFSVGWNEIGGLRLWLRDRQGNEYYYAHLSAYSTLAREGARVKAGQVIGFMGTTGDARGTQAHLHFEIHPVSLLHLGYDGAVDPTTYLEGWKRVERLPTPLPLAWAPAVPGRSAAPRAGAILLAISDISSASGLDPGSLRRAIESVRPRP